MRGKSVILAVLALGMIGHCDGGGIGAWFKSKQRKVLENRADKIKADNEAFVDSVDDRLGSLTESDKRLIPVVNAWKNVVLTLNTLMSYEMASVDKVNRIVKYDFARYHIERDREKLLKEANNFAISKLLAMEAAEKSGADTTSKECNWFLRRSRQTHMNAYKPFLDYKKRFLSSFLAEVKRDVESFAYHKKLKAFLRKPMAEIAGLEKAAEKLSESAKKFMNDVIVDYNLLTDVASLAESAADFDLDTALYELKERYETVDVSDIETRKDKREAIAKIAREYIADALKIYGTVIYTDQLDFEQVRTKIDEIPSPMERKKILSDYNKALSDSMKKSFLFIKTKLITSWQKKFRKAISTSLNVHGKITDDVFRAARRELKELCNNVHRAHTAAARKAAEAAGAELPEPEVARRKKKVVAPEEGEEREMELVEVEPEAGITPIKRIGLPEEMGSAREARRKLEEERQSAEEFERLLGEVEMGGRTEEEEGDEPEFFEAEEIEGRG